jgi:hypothetical protein
MNMLDIDVGLTVSARDCDVFLVHAGPDKDLALALYISLTALGVECFLDIACLDVGSKYENTLRATLASCGVGLIIVSPHFFEREWPQAEAEALLRREDCDVIPVFRTVRPSECAALGPLAQRLGPISGIVAPRENVSIFSLAGQVIKSLSSRLSFEIGDAQLRTLLHSTSNAIIDLTQTGHKPDPVTLRSCANELRERGGFGIGSA